MTAAAGLILDDFQRRAIEHLDAGRSVLVSAPTGAGKTVVADHAVGGAESSSSVGGTVARSRTRAGGTDRPRAGRGWR